MLKRFLWFLTILMFWFLSPLQGQNISEFENLEVDSILSWLSHNISEDTAIFQQVAHIAIGQSQEDPSQLGQAYGHLASWYGFHGLFDRDSIVLYSERSVAQFEIAKDSLSLAKAYRSLAIDYANNGSLEKASTTLFKAIPIYEALNDPIALAGIKRTIAGVSIFEKNYERAIEYGLQAYPIFEREKDYYNMAAGQLNLIEPYREIGQLEKAQEAASLCIKIAETHIPDEFGILGRAYAEKGQTSQYQKRYEQALQESKKSFEIVSKVVGPERAASYLSGVADAQMALGQIEEAAKNYDYVIKHEADYENSRMLPLYEQAIICHEKLGNLQSVVNYQKIKGNIEKSFYEDKIKNLEEESFVKYETGKKDQALAAQQLEIQQKTRIQWLSFAIGALLLLLLLAVYYNYRKTKKISAALGVKNEENELLLKEIHHRVKNNLEVVSGLLELQSAQIQDEDVQRAMLASQNRVQAMGLLHQKLYQGANLGSIEMKDYFLNLSEGVLDSFEADQRVKIELAMENLELDIDTAVPIGLIVNELLTNSLKYAFPKNQLGAINISLKEISDDQLMLQVKDDGVGFDPKVSSKGTGFGSQLVQLLTKQLGGTIHQESVDGTVVTLMLNKSKAA